MHIDVWMKIFTILIATAALYGYALVHIKSLFEGPNQMKICEYHFAQRTCGFLAQVGE